MLLLPEQVIYKEANYLLSIISLRNVESLNCYLPVSVDNCARF